MTALGGLEKRIHERKASRGTIPETERQLVEQLVRRMRYGWPVRRLGLEVKSHGRARTDICVTIRDIHSDCPELLIGVEAKLANWKKVVRQAALNRYSVDLSLIALPHSRISSTLLDVCDSMGIGVLAVSSATVNVELRGALGEPDAALRNRVMDQLEPVRARGSDPAATLIRER